MKIATWSILLIFFAVLTGCDKDDDDPSNPGGGNEPSNTSSFTCQIDGVDFIANAFLIDSISVSGSGIYYRIASGSFISGGDTTTVRITMTSPNEAGFEVGANFDSANEPDEKRCFGNVWNSSDGDVPVVPGDDPPASAMITAIDTDLEEFSGNFEFEYYDPIIETTRIVSEGVFTDISYQ